MIDCQKILSKVDYFVCSFLHFVLKYAGKMKYHIRIRFIPSNVINKTFKDNNVIGKKFRWASIARMEQPNGNYLSCESQTKANSPISKR